MCVKFGKQTRSRSWFEKKCESKLVCDVCMSLVNKPEVGAGLKKCVSKLVWCVYEFGKQIISQSWFEKKCASKLVCDVCEVW